LEIPYEAIRFLAIGQFALLSGYLLKKHLPNRAAIFGALLSACMAIYLFAPLVHRWDRNSVLFGFVLFAAFSNSFLLWMFCRSLFSDRAQVRWIHIFFWAVTQVISFVRFYQFPESFFQWGAGHPEFEFVRKLLPQGIFLAFIVAALISSQRESREDLVLPRIRLRQVLLLVSACYGIFICAAEIVLEGRPAPPGLDALHHLFLLTLAATFFREVYRHPDLFRSPEPKTNTPISPLLSYLNRWMDDEKIYRQEGLSIGGLASKMKAQEYLVRRLINQELGFRNFNDFLNQYRIREACSRLRAELELPILNLSLELGFTSLATFNRAFKAIEGQPPTEYLKKNH